MEKSNSKRITKYVLLKKILFLILVTYVFLVSIQLMGGSFKLFGKEFAEQLITTTSNPLISLFIGILATTLVQSSSVSTSLIVSLVASGALTVGGAIPMIMGANIGTSVTNSIVSLGHIRKKEEFKRAVQIATIHDFFNIIAVLILLPIELIFHPLEHMATYLTTLVLGSNLNLAFSSPLSYVVKPVSNSIQVFLSDYLLIQLLLSFVLIYASLRYFVKIITPLATLEFKNIVNDHMFRTPLVAFAVGIILTIIVQSSSVTTSLAVPIVAVGIIGLKKIYPYILGANIGTTFTAILASMVTGSPAAVIVALEHFLFNTLGTVIMYPLRGIPIRLSIFMSEIAMRSKATFFAYISSMFYIIPTSIILLFG